jgi:hypothetical protein
MAASSASSIGLTSCERWARPSSRLWLSIGAATRTSDPDRESERPLVRDDASATLHAAMVSAEVAEAT